MDFFSRLIGGGQSKPSASSNNPRQRLARFQQIYDRLLHTVQKSQSLHSDHGALESIRISFQRLTGILHDESRSPAPHLSLSFAASNQIYLNIARIASAAYNEPVIREAVAFFGALIDSEEEEFLAHERFAQSLMSFIDRISGAGNIFVGEDTEVEIVELLFGIAAKIRLQPEILPVWFRQRTTQSVVLEKEKQKQRQGFAGVTQKEDFPLCYQLIDHVHHGGRIGDFARTGLLYVFESASKSDELEQWLVESDIPTLMATGLGALYSQLSRKLSIAHPRADMPIVLLLSDYADPKPAADAESIFSPNLMAHMSTFLSYLQFWQDVLEHCNSVEVRQTLLDHFRVLFLQQLLYPSLLESSDADGGSSVAVLTYLRRILEALDHPELIHMMLQYLLAMPDGSAKDAAPSPRLVRRRQSLMLLANNAIEDDQLNPSLFSLIDLTLGSLRSRNAETITAALRLISVILSKNHTYAIGTLVKVSMTQSKEVLRTHGSLNAEMDAYLELAKGMGDEGGLDDAYENLLKDAMRLLESHTCSSQLLKLDELGFAPKRVTSSIICVREPSSHHLSAEDGMFRYLLKIVETFLTNNVEVNLGLTETIITLASCGHLRLEGWLSVEPSKYVFSDIESNMEASVQSLSASVQTLNATGDPSPPSDLATALDKARRKPNWYRRHTPPLLAALHAVHAELASIRSSVPDFDILLAARRQAFQLHDDISEAIANMPPPLPVKDHLATTPPRSQQATPAPKDRRSIPERLLADYERAISGTPLKSSPPGAGKGLNLAQRMLADYERSIGGDGSVGSEDKKSGKGSSTPRGSSKQREQSSAPGTPNPKEQKGLGSYGLIGSSTPRTPQSKSRAVSPRPEAPAARDPSDLLRDVVREADSELLRRRFQFASKDEQPSGTRAGAGAERPPNGVADGSVDGKIANSKEGETTSTPFGREATLSHILTNAVMLREFELELVAMMQVRASMFGEVKFA